MSSHNQDTAQRSTRRGLNYTAWLLVVTLTASALLMAHTWWAKPLAFDWFVARTTAQQLIDDPETTTTAALPGAWTWLRDNARLQDRSAAAAVQRQQLAMQTLATLQRYPTNKLSLEQQTNAAVLSVQLQRQIDAYAFRFYPFPIGLTDSTADALPVSVLRKQHVASQTDALDYLHRLAALRVRAVQLLRQLQMADAQQVEPPRFLVDAALQRLREFIRVPPKRHTHYLDLQHKLLRVPDAEIDAAVRSALLKRAAETLRQQVYPAYQQLIDWLAKKQPQLARNDGAWAMPNGDAYYAYCIALHTGSTLTADELHAFGLAEVARVGGQMDTLLRLLGATHGSVGMRMRVRAATPIASTSLQLQRDMRTLSSTQRSKPSPNRMAPNAAPQNTRRDLPLLRSMVPFAAFTSGWSLYRQRVSAERMPAPDDAEQLSRLQAEMLTAVHVVVDTGMHARRWSREQSIAFAIDQTGISDSNATRAIEQDLATPGRALAGAVGLRKFLEFRARAKQRLGTTFDPQRLNDVLLREGPVPWSVVERNVDAFIAIAHL